MRSSAVGDRYDLNTDAGKYCQKSGSAQTEYFVVGMGSDDDQS
jgi:hypothetical protein